jgi:hypothetical protein
MCVCVCVDGIANAGSTISAGVRVGSVDRRARHAQQSGMLEDFNKFQFLKLIFLQARSVSTSTLVNNHVCNQHASVFFHQQRPATPGAGFRLHAPPPSAGMTNPGIHSLINPIIKLCGGMIVRRFC